MSTEETIMLEYHLERIDRLGYSLVENALTTTLCDHLSAAMDSLNQAQNANYGISRLKELGDYGVVRNMLSLEQSFLDLIVHPLSLAFVDKILGSTAILHAQNGTLDEPEKTPRKHQFHRDFDKDFVCEKVLALNAFFLIDDFTEDNGGMFVVPTTHRFKAKASARYLEENKVQIFGKRGSLLIFDGLIAYKPGNNKSSAPRRAINLQYTRPFIKQQVDYVAILGETLEPESRLAQIMGFWSRPPKNVAEYRVDEDKRTYRRNQG